MNLNNLHHKLPHGANFRFVSNVVSLEQDAIHAQWILSGEESFFADHFPGQPLLPGALLSESLAQSCGLLSFADTDRSTPAQVAQWDIRFKRPIVPPGTVELHATLSQTIGILQTFNVKAIYHGKTCAQGTLSLVTPPSP